MVAALDRLPVAPLSRLSAWLRNVDAALELTPDDMLEARVYALEQRLMRLEDLQTSEKAGSDPRVRDPNNSIGE